MVPAPRCVRLSGNRFEPCDSATFHFQIHFRVAVRRGQAGMTQILADCRQVGPGLQQAYSCAVPHTVRVKPLLAEVREILASTVKTSGEDVADPKPSQGLTSMIQKHASFGPHIQTPFL